MKFKFLATENFWRKFYRLSPSQKESVRKAWVIFRENPFDSRLGTHRIHSLSVHYKKTIYSVILESNLRAVFYLEGDVV